MLLVFADADAVLRFPSYMHPPRCVLSSRPPPLSFSRYCTPELGWIGLDWTLVDWSEQCAQRKLLPDGRQYVLNQAVERFRYATFFFYNLASCGGTAVSDGNSKDKDSGHCTRGVSRLFP